MMQKLLLLFLVLAPSYAQDAAEKEQLKSFGECCQSISVLQQNVTERLQVLRTFLTDQELAIKDTNLNCQKTTSNIHDLDKIVDNQKRESYERWSKLETAFASILQLAQKNEKTWEQGFNQSTKVNELENKIEQNQKHDEAVIKHINDVLNNLINSE